MANTETTEPCAHKWDHAWKWALTNGSEQVCTNCGAIRDVRDEPLHFDSPKLREVFRTT